MQTGRPGLNCGADFRDRPITASLKQHVPYPSPPAWRHFRDRPITASLKRAADEIVRVERLAFP